MAANFPLAAIVRFSSSNLNAADCQIVMILCRNIHTHSHKVLLCGDKQP